jgi:Trk-type K+ transport system membrane component
LSYDVWWLSLAVILICVAEANHYYSQPLAFSTFNIIFEVVSAYSYVGVSVGYPGKNYSFCGEWSSFSKVLLIFISFIGRHRDLLASTGNSIWPRGYGEAADEDTKLQEKNAEHVSSATVRLY